MHTEQPTRCFESEQAWYRKICLKTSSQLLAVPKAVVLVSVSVMS